MIRDLTVGKPGSVLWRYSLPLFGSIIFQQLYNIADSFVAGRYIGTQALAAVGNSYEITLIYIAFAFGCNIGASVITARYFGLKDYKNVKSSVYTAFIASGVLGAVLTVLGLILSGTLLGLINTSADIFADSKEYLDIYIAGFIMVLVYNISTGIFSALGDSKTPFFFLAFSSVANVFMDILFVKTFGMGVAGVAWATFICQGISGILALAFMLRRLGKIKSDEKPKVFSGQLLKEIAQVAIPSILQQGFISVGNVIIQGMINGFGTSATGGYAAAIKLNNMTITSLTAIGNGMSNYTAQNSGAKKPERISRGARSGILLALAIALMFTAAYLIFGRTLVNLFITDGDMNALGIGGMFLTIVSPFYVVVAVKLVADGVLRGIKRMNLFMVSAMTDLVLRVVFSAIFSKNMGVNGIWVSWPIGWIISSAMSLGFYFYVRSKSFDTLQG